MILRQCKYCQSIFEVKKKDLIKKLIVKKGEKFSKYNHIPKSTFWGHKIIVKQITCITKANLYNKWFLCPMCMTRDYYELIKENSSHLPNITTENFEKEKEVIIK